VITGPEEAKNRAGEENVLRLIQIRLTTSSFEEISLGCQGNSLYLRKSICLAVFTSTISIRIARLRGRSDFSAFPAVVTRKVTV